MERRKGLGFIVENLLKDANECDTNKCNEYSEWDKKYDEIKQSILAIFNKIKQRKHDNHKMHNNNVKDKRVHDKSVSDKSIHDKSVGDKREATFSYINYSKVREQYRELLKFLYKEKENNQTKHRANWHIAMLYRLLAYTRDISDGCGERELTYMQLFELARVDAAAASHALKNIVTPSTIESEKPKTKKPLGSWKDIKGLVAYMRRTMNMRDECDMVAYLALTKYAVDIVNQRLAKDVLAFYMDDDEIDNAERNESNESNEVSFVSKWIPRENKSKKYGNFYERLACDYYKDWLPKDRYANPVSYEKAVVKCKIHYRKLVSLLNEYLETPQVKMCRQRWSEIAFSKMTRLTRDLQDRALLNLKPDDHRMQRHAHNSDREECAEKYKVWKCDTINRANGMNTDLETHVRVAEYYSSCNSLAVTRNEEWSAFASQKVMKSRLSHVIPVLAGNSYKAIGLALAVAENAVTGRTLILKDGTALDLHDLDASFVKNVTYLRDHVQVRGAPMYSVYSHPMYKCLISVLKLMIETNVSAKQTRHPEECGFTVAIFADDDLSHFFNDDDVSFGEVLGEASLLYREFGYKVPNVVLWAMNSTVRNENHIDDDDTDNTDDTDKNAEEMVAYKSVSHGGALTVRVGCDKNDICAYLGIGNEKEEWDHGRWDHGRCVHNDWRNEWNHLIEVLYNRRYYHFEQYIWKK